MAKSILVKAQTAAPWLGGAKLNMRRKIVAANWKMNLTHDEVKPYLDPRSFAQIVRSASKRIAQPVSFTEASPES